MKRIVLVRHGESQWNKENRFTGWTNVDLSDKGVQEAFNAGKTLKAAGYTFQVAYTSFLKRAVKTLNNVLDALDEDWIPVKKTWRLNEKHYGALQGLNKADTAKKYGDEKVLIWRRSFDVAPLPLTDEDSTCPIHDPRYAAVPEEYLPRTESLKDAIARVMPYWECEIFPALKTLDSVLVVAHGNSLRGIVKNLKGISDEAITKLNIPTGVPYVFEFDDDLKLVKDYYLGDPEEIARKQQAVANQGKAK
jgi:2,3-bisphosphoglycerate-dependent phosphoglycerate mutase